MPESYFKSYKVFNRIKFIGLIISGMGIFLMMVFIVGDVLSRNFFNKSIPGGYEIVRNYFMPVSIFPALAYAYSTGIFPRITMVVSRFSKNYQRFNVIVMLAAEGILFTLLAWYGLQYALEGVREGLAFPAGGKLYPLYPFIFLVPIGAGLLIIEVIFILIKNLYEKEPSMRVLEDQNEENYSS
ncbi:TRAP transporter small permease [Alkalihalobacterium alkalinitrilicum]|uniref:TRAP transporter small permease n=1 Tax=Alkalihalobacterium alkalinitrilicum TaxID=427920 RepID=UPI000994BF91|nr:TRAP transporter small permease [Alkalihalobacterium alkalinitrilicum]